LTLLGREGAEAGTSAAEESAEPNSPWAARDGFQLGGARSITVPILIDGEGADATVAYGRDGTSVVIDGAAPAFDAKVFAADENVFILRHGRQTRLRLKDVSAAAAEAGGGDGAIKAPMHGKVLELFVGAGDAVAGGQRLAVIEAMKMEHTLRAPFAGVVADVAVGAGVQVVEGAKIMLIERAAEG
jgi:3-methylcrotonyl-CoA carboxylase alpha subunit